MTNAVASPFRSVLNSVTDRIAPLFVPTGDGQMRVAWEAIDSLFNRIASHDGLAFAVRMGADAPRRYGTGGPACTLVVTEPGALREWLLTRDPLMGFAETYSSGHLDFEGDFEQGVALLDRLRKVRFTAAEKAALARKLMLLPSLDLPSRRERFLRRTHEKHSIQRDKDAVAYHYDVGNEFYAQFLDSSMGYTSAYYQPDTDDFDQAWRQKYEMACAKLDIGANDRVADIGCGWGGFVAHAAQHRGAVTFGVTISEKQAEWATARIAELGLGDRARVVYEHYKDMARGERFDKIAAFQCTEHMDEMRLHEFFEHMWDMLPPGGMLLVEFMTARVRLNAHPFMDQYVFPDGQQFPLDVPLSQAESVGFELLDVEGMRGDYLRTIREWNHRLTVNRERCVELVGEVKYRIWRLYLQYAAYGYSQNRFNCYQCVWRKTTRGDAAALAEAQQRIVRK